MLSIFLFIIPLFKYYYYKYSPKVSPPSRGLTHRLWEGPKGFLVFFSYYILHIFISKWFFLTHYFGMFIHLFIFKFLAERLLPALSHPRLTFVPCCCACVAARGRTNLELREKFILPEGTPQSVCAFRSRGRRSKPGSRNASPTRSSSSASHSGASAPSTPATPTASASTRVGDILPFFLKP